MVNFRESNDLYLIEMMEMMEMMEMKNDNYLTSYHFLLYLSSFHDRKIQQRDIAMFFRHFYHSYENRKNPSTKTMHKNTYIILIITIFFDLLYSNRIFNGSDRMIENILK